MRERCRGKNFVHVLRRQHSNNRVLECPGDDSQLLQLHGRTRGGEERTHIWRDSLPHGVQCWTATWHQRRRLRFAKRASAGSRQALTDHRRDALLERSEFVALLRSIAQSPSPTSLRRFSGFIRSFFEGFLRKCPGLLRPDLSVTAGWIPGGRGNLMKWSVVLIVSLILFLEKQSETLAEQTG